MRYNSFQALLLLAIAALLAACDAGGFDPRATSTLSILTIEGGTLSPAFSSKTQSYRLTLKDDGKPLVFTAVPTHDLAKITLNGQPLEAGKKSPPLPVTETPYTITLHVVSPDGTRFTDYRIIALRPGETVPDDFDQAPPGSGTIGAGGPAALQTLQLADGNLTQTFDPDSTSYDATVSYLTATTLLTAVPADPAATVSIGGTTVAPPQYSTEVALQEGANPVEVTVESADGKTTKRYVLNIVRASASGFVQRNTLFSATPQRGARFGFSMAVDGDIAAIAAPEASVDGKSKAGRVELFRYIDGNWVRTQTLTEPAPTRDNQFGYHIALDGDTLAISAFGYDGKRGNSGRVYLYESTGTGWKLESTLQAPTPRSRERFGYNVALSGDTLAVATLRGRDGAPSGGDVFIFQRDDDDWEHQQSIEIPGSSDRFGQSIALDGDLLAIGSFANDDECRRYINDTGTVTLYRRDDDEWEKITDLKADNAGGGDRFGFSLALSGKTLAIGAICEDSNAHGDNNDGTEVGAVYLFTEQAGQWRQRAYIKEPAPRSHNLFGFRVALDGNLLAIGAPLSDLKGEDTGIAYLYQGAEAQWTVLTTIQPTDVKPFDEFGVDLELRDGHLLIGSTQPQQGAATSTGKVYSYH